MGVKEIGIFEIGAEFINVDEDARDFINKRIQAVQEEIESE